MSVNYKKDFPFFNKNKNWVYLDSAATCLKPNVVIEAVLDYYTNYSTNPHNFDSKIGYKTNSIIEETRTLTQKLINAKNVKEIIFTPGTTFSINQMALGLVDLLSADDEIVLTYHEHAANILPWYEMVKQKKANIKYLEYKDNEIDINSIENVVNKNTKFVSIAHITNVFGYQNNIKKIVKKIRSISKDIIIGIDAAQSAGHAIIDVQDWDIDFLVFSGHKIYGPTGIGVLWVKENLITKIKPILLGGSMGNNVCVNSLSYEAKNFPHNLEGGTPNVAGIFGLNAALKYMMKIGVENIYKHESEIRNYAIKKFETVLKEKVIIHNKNAHGTTLVFSIKGVNSHDATSHLGHINNIVMRSGEHCAKILKNRIGDEKMIRASFALYSSKEDVDILVDAIKNENDYLGDIF